MLKIDKAIQDTSDVISNNISTLASLDRGLLSQNILSQLRNFVEYVAKKIYSNGSDIDPNDYDTTKEALKYISRRGELRFLHNFHKSLQISASHYTINKDGSERLMLKYFEYILWTKHYLKDKYRMDVLGNIQDFPMDTDTELLDYYNKIAQKINHPGPNSTPVSYNDRYYIQKARPFIVGQNVYYEITLTAANSYVSKFDRVIAFTSFEIPDNYAIKLSIHNDTINVLNKEMPILVIDSYSVSIRPCEFNNLGKAFGQNISVTASSNEYKNLMNFLTVTKMPLIELIESEQKYYDYVKREILKDAQTYKIYIILDWSREIIINDLPGCNILRYLLYKMDNRVIKLQRSKEECKDLSGLYFKYGCIPFDQMPFCTSLCGHNPQIYDVLASISTDNREHEFLARYIKNNTEINEKLFTPINELSQFSDVDSLMEKYNGLLYYKHSNRKLNKFKDYIYIEEYTDDVTKIIKQLQQLTSGGVVNYTVSVDAWLSNNAYIIDDEIKKETLRYMFVNSHVALIYGPAGTGKSTLINHIANFWAGRNKIFLANTHPAVDNLRRKVKASNSEYLTIAKFLSNSYSNVNCDILFIDECSTVSNRDMRAVLDKANFKLLILVGDIYQIESIYFGNWFAIARKFIPEFSVFELTNPFRTTDSNLLTLWNRVRNLDDNILESLVRNGYVARLDNSIFDSSEENEIVLCLNYDGLYGVNNINRFLQSNNPNEDVIWGINTYKVGDPILFNESNIFSPLIHNNSKGKIVGIKTNSQQIKFYIELEDPINEIDALGYNFELEGSIKEGNSIISFVVNSQESTDEDDYRDSTLVPFQVAYAISIHKAQGLEYDSVKIVITKEIEEQITHNIFYTAITRAKKKLKIYWSPETEQAVLGQLELKNTSKDAHLLAQLSSLKENS